MRVFVAGASGAIGRPLIPSLVAAGHEVTGMTRSERRRRDPPAGATPRSSTPSTPTPAARGRGRRAPEVVVHELTALPSASIYARELYEATNRPHRGHAQPDGGRARRRRPAIRLPEHRLRVPERAAAVMDEDAPLMTAPARSATACARSSHGAGGPPRRGPRTGSCCARLLLRARHALRRETGTSSGRPPAPSRWSARGPVCSRSSTSTTPPRPPRPPSSAGSRHLQRHGRRAGRDERVAAGLAEARRARPLRVRSGWVRLAGRRPTSPRWTLRGARTTRRSASWAGSRAHPSWRPASRVAPRSSRPNWRSNRDRRKMVAARISERHAWRPRLEQVPRVLDRPWPDQDAGDTRNSPGSGPSPGSRSPTSRGRGRRARGAKVSFGADERRVHQHRERARAPRGRRLPRGRARLAGLVPRRPLGKPVLVEGPRRRRQDRAREGGLARHRRA